MSPPHEDPTDAWPLCEHCGQRIPRFADLAEAEERRVRQLIRDNRPIAAAAELAWFTRCPEPIARLWVAHRGQPLPVRPGPPCRFCAAILPTSLARQCLSCGMDWHDPGHPRKLGTG